MWPIPPEFILMPDLNPFIMKTTQVRLDAFSESAENATLITHVLNRGGKGVPSPAYALVQGISSL